MLQRLGVACVALAATAACNSFDFSGDRNAIGFNSDLHPPYGKWDPSTPVAVGSRFSITANKEIHYDDAGFAYGPPPTVTGTLSDGGALELEDAGTNLISIAAKQPGSATISWSGSLEDHFTITAEPATSAELVEFFRYLSEVNTTPPSFGSLGPAPDHSVVHVTGGEELFLQLVAHGEGGGVVAHSARQFDVTTDGGVLAEPLFLGVRFEVPEGAAGEVGTATVLWDGGALLTTTIVREDPAAATALELAAVRFGTNAFLVMAIPRVDGGAPLYQAPIEWIHDPHFVENDFEADLLPGYPHRTDVRWFAWSDDGGFPGTFDQKVIARLGTLEASLTLPIDVPPDSATGNADPVPAPAPNGLGLCCGMSSTGLVLFAGWPPIVVLLQRLRRRGRGASLRDAPP